MGHQIYCPVAQSSQTSNKSLWLVRSCFAFKACHNYYLIKAISWLLSRKHFLGTDWNPWASLAEFRASVTVLLSQSTQSLSFTISWLHPHSYLHYWLTAATVSCWRWNIFMGYAVWLWLPYIFNTWFVPLKKRWQILEFLLYLSQVLESF